MIDWWMVISNAIWIGGCALALAAASYASWQASMTHRRWRDVVGQPPMQQWLSIAAALFCLGLAATSRSGWETVVWLLLTIAFIVRVIRDRRAH